MKRYQLVLGISLAGLLAAAGAWAQTVVLGSAIATRPDGGTQEWFPNDGHTDIRQPDGATAQVDRQGNVTNWTTAPSCQNPTKAAPAGSQRECRKGPDGKIRAYMVHFQTYTCSNPPQARRVITTFVETNAGPPCTEEDYGRDMKGAASAWGETWTVPGRTVQKKGKEKKVAKKAPGKQPSRTVDDGGGGQINIGIGIGGGGERGRREREHRREREGGGIGSFGR